MLADQTGLAIAVSSLSAESTSKWNKIETSLVLFYQQELARAAAHQPESDCG